MPTSIEKSKSLGRVPFCLLRDSLILLYIEFKEFIKYVATGSHGERARSVFAFLSPCPPPWQRKRVREAA